MNDYPKILCGTLMCCPSTLFQLKSNFRRKKSTREIIDDFFAWLDWQGKTFFCTKSIRFSLCCHVRIDLWIKSVALWVICILKNDLLISIIKKGFTALLLKKMLLFIRNQPAVHKCKIRSKVQILLCQVQERRFYAKMQIV